MFKNKIKSHLLTLLLTFFTLGPIIVLLSKGWILGPDDLDTWNHLAKNLIPDLLKNTLFLSFFTVTISTFIGVSLAIIISFTDIKYKKIINIFLIIPLAYPLYVMAFIYSGTFEYSGGFHTFFREFFNINLIPYLNIKSPLGVATVLSFALYPYVYIITLDGMGSISSNFIMASKSLGHNSVKTLTRVILPYSRPWIMAGAGIVLLETLADFGAVSVFNYDTFTTAIYSAWSSFFSIASAARLSIFLLIMALTVFAVEKRMELRTRFYSACHSSCGEIFILKRSLKLFVYIFIFLIIFLTSALPLYKLITWSLESISIEWSDQYFQILKNTISIGVLAAILTCTLALTLAFLNKISPSRLTSILTSLSLLGYALPGSLIAVAVFVYASQFGNRLFSSAPIIVLMIGLMIRFIMVGYRQLHSSLKRINPNLEFAAKSLKMKNFTILRKVHLPIISQSMYTALLLIFIEVIKEMPMTLMLRPFGFNTLSVKIYELTSEGEWERASIAGFILVMTGLLGVLIMEKIKSGSRNE